MSLKFTNLRLVKFPGANELIIKVMACHLLSANP